MAPIVIRSPVPLGEGFQQRMRTQLGHRMGHAEGLIERVTVRFEDINGPKGGVDTVCRIKVVVKRRPSIQTTKQDESIPKAFARAVHAVGVAVDRMHQKYQLRAAPRMSSGPISSSTGAPQRVRRTRLARTTRATAALEESMTRPSRKSTRRSANHGKPSQTKERAAAMTMLAPTARMTRRG